MKFITTIPYITMVSLFFAGNSMERKDNHVALAAAINSVDIIFSRLTPLPLEVTQENLISLLQPLTGFFKLAQPASFTAPAYKEPLPVPLSLPEKKNAAFSFPADEKKIIHKNEKAPQSYCRRRRTRHKQKKVTIKSPKELLLIIPSQSPIGKGEIETVIKRIKNNNLHLECSPQEIEEAKKTIYTIYGSRRIKYTSLTDSLLIESLKKECDKEKSLYIGFNLPNNCFFLFYNVSNEFFITKKL